MGTRTGVFVGIGGTDYACLNLKQADRGRLDAYFGTGNALSVATGRLSYVLGLRGPSVSELYQHLAIDGWLYPSPARDATYSMSSRQLPSIGQFRQVTWTG